MWTCPNCGRQFKSANQWHSCKTVQVEDLFMNKSQDIKDLYTYLNQVLSTIGKFRISAVKNAILLSNQSTFLAIKPRKSSLQLEFVYNEKIDTFPVVKSVPYTRTKWAHVAIIEKPDDVNEELQKWLKRSYKLCG